jgi:hypothetical protein
VGCLARCSCLILELKRPLTPFGRNSADSPPFPQTLGYGLVDAPIGQLIWLVDELWASKFDLGRCPKT